MPGADHRRCHSLTQRQHRDPERSRLLTKVESRPEPLPRARGRRPVAFEESFGGDRREGPVGLPAAAVEEQRLVAVGHAGGPCRESLLVLLVARLQRRVDDLIHAVHVLQLVGLALGPGVRERTRCKQVGVRAGRCLLQGDTHPPRLSCPHDRRALGDAQGSERRQEFLGGGALRRLVRKARRQHVGESWRQASWQRGGLLLHHDRRHDLLLAGNRAVGLSPGGTPTEHLDDDAGQRPDVALVRDGADVGVELLRSHVHRSAQAGLGGRGCDGDLGERGDAEVRDRDRVVLVEQQIGGLEVLDEDADRVEIPERARHLQRKLQRGLEIQRRARAPGSVHVELEVVLQRLHVPLHDEA
jgi:hypothetical protein